MTTPQWVKDVAAEIYDHIRSGKGYSNASIEQAILRYAPTESEREARERAEGALLLALITLAVLVESGECEPSSPALTVELKAAIKAAHSRALAALKSSQEEGKL